MTRPAASVQPAFTNTGTRMRTPGMKAVMPIAPSKYSGSSTLSENVVIIATTTSSTAGQNRTLLMGAMSMRG